MPGIGVASPSYSLSTPAMIFSNELLPEPLMPSMPILAPGKNDSEMSLRICRLGGTVLETRFIVKTYWAMVRASGVLTKEGALPATGGDWRRGAGRRGAGGCKPWIIPAAAQRRRGRRRHRPAGPANPGAAGR